MICRLCCGPLAQMTMSKNCFTQSRILLFYYWVHLAYLNLPRTQSDIQIFISDLAYEPKAIPEWPDRKASVGEAQVGYGVQGIPCVC